MSEQPAKIRVLNQCISPASKTVGHHRHREPELLLIGLAVLWEKNRSGKKA